MRRLAGICVVVVVSCLMAGCSPASSGDDPVSSTPVVVESTPSPSPTPTWSGEQQAAIDAVQKYLQVWAEITQNLGTSDWDQIYEVAYGPITNTDMDAWKQWNDQGLFLVGHPSFTTSWVTSGAQDTVGKIYHVGGCYIIEGSYLSDASGTRVPVEAQRQPSTFDVLEGANGQNLVTDSRNEGTC